MAIRDFNCIVRDPITREDTGVSMDVLTREETIDWDIRIKYLASLSKQTNDPKTAMRLSATNKSVERRYINTTNVTLRITERTGIVTILNKTNTPVVGSPVEYNNSLVVIDNYSIPIKEAETEYNEIIRNREHSNSVHYEYDNGATYTSIFMNEYAISKSNGHEVVSFGISSSIKASELFKNNKLFDVYYLPSYDLLISNADDPTQHIHPFSNTHKISAFIDNLSKTAKGMIVAIDIIDNENSIGNRWVNLFGDVKLLTPRKDANHTSGVRLIYYWPTIDPVSNGVKLNQDSSIIYKEDSVVYSLEEADEILKLYKSKEAAITSGDTSILLKAEIEKLKTEQVRTQVAHEQQMAILKEKLEVLKHERDAKMHKLATEQEEYKQKWDIRKYEWEREASALKQKIEKDKHDQEVRQYEMENYMMGRKQQYRERDMERSEWKENIKLTAIVVAALVTIGGIVLKK